MSEQILNLILDKLTNIESDIKELKEFKQDMTEFKQDMTEFKQDMTEFKQDMTEFKNDVTKRLSNISITTADNQVSNLQIRSTVIDTNEKINKLYNKIDEFLTVSQHNEVEIYALTERTRDHEDRITVLESKAL